MNDQPVNPSSADPVYSENDNLVPPARHVL